MEISKVMEEMQEYVKYYGDVAMLMYYQGNFSPHRGVWTFCLSVCLSVLSVCLSVCLSVYLFCLFL